MTLSRQSVRTVLTLPTGGYLFGTVTEHALGMQVAWGLSQPLLQWRLKMGTCLEPRTSCMAGLCSMTSPKEGTPLARPAHPLPAQHHFTAHTTHLKTSAQFSSQHLSVITMYKSDVHTAIYSYFTIHRVSLNKYFIHSLQLTATI